jgi:hypothetical protein
MDEALQIWKKWFEYSGSPWVLGSGGWFEECFFCGENIPNHEDNCVYVKAKKLIDSEKIYCYEHSPDKKFVCTLEKGHAGQHIAHVKNDIVVCMW